MGCTTSKSVVSSGLGSKVSLENGSNGLKTLNHHPSEYFSLWDLGCPGIPVEVYVLQCDQMLE